MRNRFWHRLRGHSVLQVERHIDMGSRGPCKIIEAGRVEYGFRCSCGQEWWNQ